MKKDFWKYLNKKGQVCRNLPEQKVQTTIYDFYVDDGGQLHFVQTHELAFGNHTELDTIFDKEMTEQIYDTLRDYYIELESEEIGKKLMAQIKRKETEK